MLRSVNMFIKRIWRSDRVLVE